MNKFIYLLQAPQDHGLNAKLRAAGDKMLALDPLGLRLNLHDKYVAEGPQHWPVSAYGPFDALVQIWLEDSDIAPYERYLSETGAVFHGYLVEERLLVNNLGNQLGPEGRNEGYSQFAMLQIPKRLDRATWLSCWQDRHTWVALSIHPHLEYTQNPVLRAVTPNAPPIDGFGEETFPIGGLTEETVLFKAEGNPEKFQARRAVMYEDAERFIDFDHLDMVLTSQYDLRATPR